LALYWLRQTQKLEEEKVATALADITVTEKAAITMVADKPIQQLVFGGKILCCMS
jgi:hypothetical protein